MCAEERRLAKVHPSKVEGSNGRIKPVCTTPHSEEIFVGRIERQSEDSAYYGSANQTSYLLRHLHTQQPKQKKAQERQKKNQKCITVLFHYVD